MHDHNGRPGAAYVDKNGRPPLATFTVCLFEGGHIGCGLEASQPLSTAKVAETLGRAIYQLIAEMKAQAKPQIAAAPSNWQPPQM